MSLRDSLLQTAAGAAALLLIPTGVTAGPWIPLPGEYYSELTAAHLSLDSYFDEQGDHQQLPLGTLVEGRQLSSHNEIGWRKWASLVLQVPVASVTVRSESPRLNGSQTGLADLVVGARFKLLDGSSALAAEADWKAPMGYDRDAFPSLGAGQQDVSGTLHFGTALPRLDGFMQVSWGYIHRFEAPPDEMLHTADLGVWVGSSLLLAGHYRGLYFAASGDDPALDADFHVAGPELRYRLDDRLDMFVGSNYVFAGRNADRSDEYYVGLAVKQTRLNRLQGFLGGKRRP
jgi:hypothetical protein